MKIFKNVKLIFSTTNKIKVNFFCNKINLQKLAEELGLENDEDRDLRLEDEFFYFQKEWNRLQKEKKDKYQDYLTKDLTEYQLREIDILSQTIAHFSPLEAQYFSHVLEDLMNRKSSTEIESINCSSQKNQITHSNARQEYNPNYLPTQEALIPLLPFLASGFFSGGAAQVVVQEEKKVEKVEQKAVGGGQQATLDVIIIYFNIF